MLVESIAPAVPVIHEPRPVRLPLRLDEVDSIAVGPRLFNQLAAGQLSAVVVPEALRTPEGMNLQIVNSRAPHQTVSLEIGRSLSAAGEPGLRAGYKAVSLHLPPGRRLNEAALHPTARPSFALAAAHLKGRSFLVKYAMGSLHGAPMCDGGTIHLHEGGQVRLTRVAAMLHGDMPGITPGYEMITLPLRPRMQAAPG